jgi:4-hydroxythreonine-4-phosphate dehydrogenase
VTSIKKIAITTGDTDGIGLEVTVKALSKLGPQRNSSFYLFRSSRSSNAQLRLLDKKFNRKNVSSLEEALKIKPSSSQIIEIVDDRSPALWVEDSARSCLQKKFDSMVTAPLSKQEILEAGLSDIGHTDILKRISGSNSAFMGFFGKYFNVILASAHIPLSEVENYLTAEILSLVKVVSLDSRKLLSTSSRKKPVGVLGLNPHAGDKGILGRFDEDILKKYINMKDFVGPLVPDVAFLRANWSRFSFYLALYHDQGLIPFKTVHGFDSGAHLTLGLPIKRSSVDHGTAKDLFGKNKANPGSMIEAIKWGVKLCSVQ